jgi:molybdopterin molybdotransferase
MHDIRLKGFKKYNRIDDILPNYLKEIQELPFETILTENSLKRIVASDILSPVNVPHFSRSAMDGFAIRSETTFGASPNSPKIFKLVGKLSACETSSIGISTKDVIQVATGSPIPPNADAVIKLENTKRLENQIEVYFPVTPGQNISKIGEDIEKGDLLLSKGHSIRPQDIPLLLECSINELKVIKKPKVAIFPTGSELVHPGSPPEIGKIIETNSYSIAALSEIYGAQPFRFDIVPDDLILLQKAIEKGKMYDIIVFSGGTSVGEYDLLPSVISSYQNGKMIAHGFAMRPGSPTAIGFIDSKPIFCLPGFPVATMISFEVFVGPTIRTMLGAKKLDIKPLLYAELSKNIPSELGRRDFVRVSLEIQENKIYATPTRLKGSSLISSLVKSDGIVEIPENVEGLEKGMIVPVRLFPIW